MNQNHAPVDTHPDPEVKPKKATRRKMSAKYKQSILEKTGLVRIFRRKF